jgi:hypothetical protein
MRGLEVGVVVGIPGWHARGQGFKSPQLHHHNTAVQLPCRLRPQHAASPSNPGLGHTWGMTASATASRSAITATTRACIASVMCR